MPGESARRVISEVEASWTPIRTALETLPDAALEAAPPGTWSAKETLAHLAFWSEAVEGYMTLVVRQRPLPGGWRFGSGYSQEVDAPWPHFEVHNAREAAWGGLNSLRWSGRGWQRRTKASCASSKPSLTPRLKPTRNTSPSFRRTTASIRQGSPQSRRNDRSPH